MNRAANLWSCLLVIMSVGLGSCSRQDEPAPVVRPVLTTAVTIETAETFGPFAGTIEARYQSQLGFQVPGRIVSRDVQVGDVVKKGRRVAALDTAVLQFQVTSARADVTNAEATLANASGTEERQRALLPTSATTQATLDNAVAAKQTAAARRKQALANLKKAQDQLGYSEIKADFDGVVTSFGAEVGQFVTVGQTVVTIARPEVREAVFDVPDDLIGDIPQDVTFNIVLQADEKATTRGRLREVVPQADAATRTRRIRLALDNPPPAFRLGSTVTVSFPRPVPARTRLPVTALTERDGRPAVWLFDPTKHTVNRVAVQVTARNEHQVTILPTLKDGDRVVVAGVNSLRDEQAVKPEAAP